MKHTLTVLLILLSLKLYSQSSKVIYIVPDSVEVAIKAQIVKLKQRPSNSIIYFLLDKNDSGVYRLSLIHEPKSKKSDLEGKALRGTNRVLLIDDAKYPLLFDYDFTFGTPNELEIGKFGAREGNVVRSTILTHGYSILFNMKGEKLR